MSHCSLLLAKGIFQIHWYTNYICIFLFVAGNLISIGPGLYESNHTLDGATRGIYVLGSCEFMHDGKLDTISFYVASSDWLSLQIWRPMGGYLARGSMQLVFQRDVDITQSSGKYQVKAQSILSSKYVHNRRLTYF